MQFALGCNAAGRLGGPTFCHLPPIIYLAFCAKGHVAVWGGQRHSYSSERAHITWERRAGIMNPRLKMGPRVFTVLKPHGGLGSGYLAPTGLKRVARHRQPSRRCTEQGWLSSMLQYGLSLFLPKFDHLWDTKR
jgi:hypothetical protein